MPVYKCPLESCNFETADITDGLAVQMLTIHATVHTNPNTASPAPTTTPSRLEKVRRPVVSASGTGEDWNYFVARWDEYKAATRVTGRELVLQLLECCEEELRKDLTRTAGGSLAENSEAEVLAAIKQLEVQEENILLARVELYNMRQDAGEEIRLFGARIRGKANLCNFVLPCPAAGCTQNVNYMDEILRHVLIRGISDPDIRLEILRTRTRTCPWRRPSSLLKPKKLGNARFEASGW